MSTLAERIERILQLRRWTQRDLSRRAGLSDAHVAQILHRARKNPDGAADEATLKQIAAAANVSLAWLARDEGSPTLEAPDDAPRPHAIFAALGVAFESSQHRTNVATELAREALRASRGGAALADEFVTLLAKAVWDASPAARMSQELLADGPDAPGRATLAVEMATVFLEQPSAPPPPPALPAPPPALPQPIDDAIGHAFRELDAIAPETFAALRDGLRPDPPHVERRARVEQARAAMVWLTAAAELQGDRRRVTPGALLAVVTRRAIDALDALVSEVRDAATSLDGDGLDEDGTKACAEELESAAEAAEQFAPEARNTARAIAAAERLAAQQQELALAPPRTKPGGETS